MKKTKQIPNVLWVIVLIICVSVFIYSLYRIIPPLLAYRAAGTEYGSLADIAHAPAEATSDDESGSPIDFAALSAINPDIVGWIVVEGTGIDYPVVQGPDNDVYLHRTFSGEQNASGAIFLEYRCTPDFSDKHSIVYGHMMKNGSMFAGLTEYKSQGFYDQNPSFTLYTPDAVYTCEVFSAYVTSSDSVAYTPDFDNDTNFQEFLNEVLSLSLVQAAMSPTVADRLITLSTCDYTYEDARMVVHARLRPAGDAG